MLKLLRKRKRGFTLTETIVVIALLGIIMVCVVAFSTPVRTMIKNTSAKGDALSINKIMGDYIERRLAYASSVHAYSEVNFDSILAGGSNAALAAEYTSCMGTPGTPGMIVIKYEPDTAQPFKSTYRIYDVSLSGTTALSDTIENVDGVIHPKNAVYADAFYAGYEYFIGMNPDIDINALKNKAYISFEIDAYNFTEDYGYKLDTSTMTKFYSPVAVPGYATLKDKGVNLMNEEKIGTENVSFALENVTSTVSYEEEKDASGHGTGVFKTVEKINGCKFHNVRLEAAAGGSYAPAAADVGNDIVIFYNIRKY